MAKKSTASKTSQGATSAPKSPTSRKSTAARTKLPVAEAAIVEAAAAPVETVVETPVIEAPAPARLVDRGEFEALVRKSAYELSERRGFRNGSAFEDWLRAEAAVREQLAAEGATAPQRAS